MSPLAAATEKHDNRPREARCRDPASPTLSDACPRLATNARNTGPRHN